MPPEAFAPPQPNVSILWDIENVTPSRGAFFTGGLLELARKEGSLSSATAIGNWRGSLTNDLAVDLSENGFELIHVPQPAKKGRAKKNSADFALITRATEMVFQYPHIQTYIILTGDIDFRALLQMLKKHGKRIVIVCDVKTVSENLLEFADEYLDYRNLLPDDDTEDTKENAAPTKIGKKIAFAMLSETVRILESEKKITNPGGVKVRMKLLNENFSGDIEGYTSWKAFINDAVKHKIVGREDTDKGIVLTLPGATTKGEDLPPVFESLLKAIQKLSPKKDWVNFAHVGKQLVTDKVSIRDYNYSQLRKLIIDAEKRGLVETTNKEGGWYVQRVKA